MSTNINNVNTDTLNVYNNTSAPSKVCSQCHQNKLLTEYNKDKRKSDGLQNDCKSCQSIKRKHYQDNNKQINANRIYDEYDVKICSKCKQSKPLTDYYKDRTNSSGLESYCKSCRSIKSKHYYDKNKQINANRIFTENDIRTCSTCKQQKLYTEFNKCISDKSGLESYCKDCRANDHKEYFRKQFSKVLNKAIKDNI